MADQIDQVPVWLNRVLQFLPVESSVAVSVFALIKWWRRQRNAEEKRQDALAKTEAQHEAEERIRQDRVDAAQTARLEAELVRVYARLTEAEQKEIKARRDADDGWWLARHYHAELSWQNPSARNYRHEMNGYVAKLNGYVAVLQSLLRAADLSLPRQVEMAQMEVPQLDIPAKVPALEEPLGKR